MLHAAPIAALFAGLVLAVPSTAQVGSGKIAYSRPGSNPVIFTVNPDGSGERLIRSEALMPKWSRDGSQIAFVQLHAPPAVDSQLYVMNADGSGARAIPSAANPVLSSQAWPPDGTRIAFAGRELRNNISEYDIYVANLSGGPPLRLTFDGGYKGAPAWSPTGTQLVYSANRQPTSSPPMRLYVVDAEGGTPTAITHDQEEPVADAMPVWSPDGRSIAFIRTGRVTSLLPTSVFVVGPDGSGLHRVTDVRQFYPEEPAWSPDGGKIAFSTEVNSPDSQWGPGREIYVVNADGSGLTRLTHGAPRLLADTDPMWSPDGEQLTFIRQRREIHTMNVDGTCLGRLWHSTGAHMLSWQPLPGGLRVGSKRCHALAVEGDARVSVGTATISATVVNAGTEPLSGIEFAASASNDLTLTAARAPSGAGSCRLALNAVTCRLSRLGRGGRAEILMEASGRRVTFVSDPRRANVSLTLRMQASAAEELLPNHRESGEVAFEIHRCTAGARGGGELSGTHYRDELCGRRGADRITPRGSRDTVDAGSGNDVVLARDGFRDVILCGPGRDRVLADKRDFVGRDCERVTRR